MVKLIGGSILVSVDPPALFVPSPTLQIISACSEEILLGIPLTGELEQLSSQTPDKPVINSPSSKVNVGHQKFDDSAFVQEVYVTPLKMNGNLQGNPVCFPLIVAQSIVKNFIGMLINVSQKISIKVTHLRFVFRTEL